MDSPAGCRAAVAVEPKSTSLPRRFDSLAKGDDGPTQQPEVDAQSTAISRKRRLIHKKPSKAKKARIVVGDEEVEEFQSSAGEHEEEENILYADG
uniref:Uncharacterized protein n=1 Tax=Oryza punctata TaxID=4537 RepID=A0A0E0KP64_ORYPU